MRIVFLDFDGVMNSDEYFTRNPVMGFGKEQVDPEKVHLLNALVGAADDIYVVISSSWRVVWDPEAIQQMLHDRGFKFSRRVIDRTRSSVTGFRGKEIEDWLGLWRERREIDPDAEPITSYVILDDGKNFTTDQHHERLVRTDARVGLTEDDVEQALEILGV